MSLFPLVHGSKQHARGCDLLVPELEQRGHDVLIVDLPPDTPEASATGYAGIMASKVPDNSAESIVIAHSASGLFLPLVAEQRQVARLVFLAAVIPKIGMLHRWSPHRGSPGWK